MESETSPESPRITVWQAATPAVSQTREATTYSWTETRRAIKACENCRLKKIKCDEAHPSCLYCRRRKLACIYRKDHEAARDPSLNLISEKLTQLYNEIRTLGRRLDKVECPDPATSNDQRFHAVSGQLQSGGEGGGHISAASRLESSPSIQTTATLAPKLPRTAASPSSCMLRWETVQTLHPMVSRRYLQDDMSSAYSATGDAFALLSSPSTQSLFEPGQVYFYIRNFLSLAYPLYPIMCEQAVADMETAVIRDGMQINVPSALVLLMKTLGKLYSGTYDLVEHADAIAHLDSAVRLLSWLPLEYTLEHAQAYTLTALCFAKLSMLSSSAIYLRQASTVLYEFLTRKILVPSAIKPTTRTTSVRLYWVLLNLERDMNWETNLYPRSLLGDLEDCLPLPFECMVEEFSSSASGPSPAHMPFRAVIDSCYSLFLVETSLRQIIWRAATTPELQQQQIYSSEGVSSAARRTAPPLHVIREIETQFSKWLACIPECAGWTPGACTGQMTPLSSRVRLQYWFGRFQLYKVALYSVLDRQDHGTQTLDSLTLTWLHDAVNAAFNALSVFVLENFIPDDIFAHRIFVLVVVLRSAISVLGLPKILSFCSTITTTPDSLLQRSIARLEFLALSSPSSSSSASNPHHHINLGTAAAAATTTHYADAAAAAAAPLWATKRVQSRWITEDLRNLQADLNLPGAGSGAGAGAGVAKMVDRHATHHTHSIGDGTANFGLQLQSLLS